VLVAGPDGPSPALVVSRREFAGYWEYLLPDAIFTSPPYRSFGGAALIGSDGRLLGIGSLIVADAAAPGEQLPGNMFVPISALKPIMGDLLREGRASKAPRPWLGLYTQEVRGHILISRVAPGGPADTAGISANAIVTAVGDKPVSSLAEFYRAVWDLGEAGVEVPLTLMEATVGQREVVVTSGNRYDYLQLNPTY
jgi:S1-C subfamily serine protease